MQVVTAELGGKEETSGGSWVVVDHKTNRGFSAMLHLNKTVDMVLWSGYGMSGLPIANKKINTTC